MPMFFRGLTDPARWQAGWCCIALLLGMLTAGAPRSMAALADVVNDGRFPAAPMREEVLTLPGDPADPVRLEATLFLPPGAGPFPLAVMNHGATNVSMTNRGERYRSTTAAYYFLSRGYAVMLPMARGFAGSDGNIVHGGCDLAMVARRNGADIAGAIEALARRPEIDRRRIVVAGQSFGGWNTLGLGTLAPAGVRGLIGFSPAIRTSDCHDQDRSLAAAAANLAAHTTLPSLWFFGENDSVMPTVTWRTMFERYKAAGGRAELADLGRIGTDSHQMLASAANLPAWTPRADAFLARVGLPSAILYPEFLPHRMPPPTHWASLNDVNAVPGLNEPARALYRKFLAAPLPRAFVVAPGRGVSDASGGYDPIGFALRSCSQKTSDCRLYAVDNQVVWTGGPASDGGLRRVVKRVRPDVATWLGGFYSVREDCSSRGLPMVAVSERPQHGMVQVIEHEQAVSFPPGSPFASCNKRAVPAMGVTYTPAPGYTGADGLTLDETDLDGQRHVIHVGLTVQ